MNASDYIIDIREYDVPYHVRVAIDKGVYISVCRFQESFHLHPIKKFA